MVYINKISQKCTFFNVFIKFTCKHLVYLSNIRIFAAEKVNRHNVEDYKQFKIKFAYEKD